MRDTKRRILERTTVDKTKLEADIKDIVKESLNKKSLEANKAYGIITCKNANVGESASVENLYKLCKQVYTIWYSRIIKEKHLTKEQQASVEILKQKYNAYNMTPEECYNFIADTFRKEFSNSGLTAPASLQSKPMDATASNSIVKDGEIVYNDFLHLYPYGLDKEIEVRLYLNLKPGCAVEFERELFEETTAASGVYSKVYVNGIHPDIRSDSALVYCSYDEADYIIECIDEIKKRRPELFEDCEKMNPFWGKINGYIGIGEEPKNPKKKMSFSEARAYAIDDFINDKKASLYKQIGNIADKELPNAQMTFREVLIQKYLNSLKEAIAEEIEKNNNGEVPSYIEARGVEAVKYYSDYLRFVQKQLASCSKTSELYKQIEDKVDRYIAQLKKGKCASERKWDLKFATRDPKKANAIRGYCVENDDGGFELTMGLKIPKLEDILEENLEISSKISENATLKNLDPYFKIYGITVEYPHLNIETAKELNNESESE